MSPSSRIDEGRTLNPGILRHRIEWQRKDVTGQDPSGGDIYTWSRVTSCAAQVRTMSGRELEAAQQKWAEAQYAIRHHYIPGLDETYRIAWFVDGTIRYLDPVNIADLAGTGRVLNITAKDSDTSAS